MPTPFVRPEATTWSVEDILRRAKDGQLYIPIFQRSFRWEADDVRKLFDSIYRGYPIGDLLLWETDRTQGAATSFGPVNFPQAKGRGFVIIDGQQRITTLVAVLLRSGVEGGKFNLCFDLKDGKFHLLRARSALPDTWLPLSEVSDTVRFLEWLQERRLPSELVSAANLLVRSLRDYRLPVYVVHTDDEKQIREIFERLNTTGKRLKATEIFAALRRGRQGTDLSALSEGLKGLGFGTLEEDWLLKAVAAVLGIDVTKNLGEALRSVTDEEVQKGFVDAERAIREVVRFLRQDADIPHIELLPYRFPLVPLTKLFHIIPKPSAKSRQFLAAWVWRGAWSKAHERSDAPMIRAALEHVTHDEEATVERLLASTPAPEGLFEIPRHDFRSAGTKITCAALISFRPRHLVTGEEIDVPGLLSESGANALLPIVRKRIEGVSETQNRLVHGELEASVRDAILYAPQDVLDSHCIPSISRDYLASGREDYFLSTRRSYLRGVVSAFLRKSALVASDV